MDGAVATRTDQNGTVLTWSYDSLRRKTEEEVTTVGSGVDSTVRSATWTYTVPGLVKEVTYHSDTTPNMDWSDAINQVKHTYDAGNKLTTFEVDYDSEVGDNAGIDTRSTTYTYGTDFSTGNYKRVNHVTYPSGRIVWNGYTHSDTSGTLQDTINDKFSRVGQLAADDSGSIGDIIAEYDFNGLGRFVQRNHDSVGGAGGNDTKMTYYSGGVYGFDRFGRPVDLRHVEYSGTPAEFDRYQYSYDRASNRTRRENVVYPARSQTFTYNDLHQLTAAPEGFFNSSDAVHGGDITRTWSLDDLGNLTAFGWNGVGSTITHATNATNEITTLAKPNVGGAAKVINDLFSSTVVDLWNESLGTWSISSGEVNVDTLDGGASLALLSGGTTLDDGALEVKITVPAGSTNEKAGIAFSDDGKGNYFAVVLDQSSGGKIALYQYTNNTPGAALASANATIATQTQYTITVVRDQRHVYALKVGESAATFGYDASNDLERGGAGLISTKTNVKFDNFFFKRADGYTAAAARWRGTASVSYFTGGFPTYMQITGSTHAGEVMLDGFEETDCVIQYDANLNGARDCIAAVRVADPANRYHVRLTSTHVYLIEVWRGKRTTVASASHSASSWIPMKIKLNGSAIQVWVNGSRKINATHSAQMGGGLAFSGENARIKSIVTGYDDDADDDIDTETYNASHPGSSISVTHDNNGNVTSDGVYAYVYDPWNRVVTVKSQEDAVTLAAYNYDGLGRRIKKVVTNTGDFDGTQYFYYDERWRMLESRDGSENLDTQIVYGTQYVDEIVRFEKQGKGTMYVFQDANWNVTSTVNYDGVPLDRIHTSPYGQPLFNSHTINGDYDGDGDIDSSDDGNFTTCEGGAQPVTGACRVFDLNNDGDVDGGDATLFALIFPSTKEIYRISAQQRRSANGFAFAHQGLMLDEETQDYYNRHRQYDPWKMRFLQRDPLRQIQVMDAAVMAFARRQPEQFIDYVDGMNLYGYARQNPVGNRDPVGLCAAACTAAGNPTAPAAPCGNCGNCFAPGTTGVNCGSGLGTCICNCCGRHGGGSQTCKVCWSCRPNPNSPPAYAWIQEAYAIGECDCP